MRERNTIRGKLIIQHVSDSFHRVDDTFPELLTECGNMRFERDRIHGKLCLSHTPHSIEDFHFCLRISFMTSEKLKDPIFLTGQLENRVSFFYKFFSGLDRVWSEANLLFDRFFFSSTKCDDAKLELSHIEWLRDIIIDSSLEHRDFVIHKRIRSQCDHGSFDSHFSDFLDKCLAIHDGHIHIENNHVIMSIKQGNRLFAMDRSLDGVSLQTEIFDDIGTNMGMIFDDEHFHREENFFDYRENF